MVNTEQRLIILYSDVSIHVSESQTGRQTDRPTTGRLDVAKSPLCAYVPRSKKLLWSLSGKSLKLLPWYGHILALKCTKFDFGWGSASDPAWGSLQRSTRPPGWILRAYFQGEEEEGRKGRERGSGKKKRKCWRREVPQPTEIDACDWTTYCWLNYWY